MIKSLVTGGAGFIGAHVSRELIKLGHTVVILDDLSGGFSENVPAEAVFIKGSITDHALVTAVFSQHKFDYVYHLAAYAAEGLSHFIKRFNYTVNLVGSVNLINESVRQRVKCFVFTSSIAVYGKGQLPMTETMTPLPEDPYGIAKLAVEQDLKSTHEQFGLNYIVFRPHNVFGEYQNIGDKYRNVVGIFINQLMQGLPLTIFGDGTQTRAFSYIGDIAPLVANAVHIPGAYNETFNVGAEETFTVAHLAEEVCRLMHLPGNLRYLPARNEVQHAFSDHGKAKQVFGEYKSTPLTDGLSRMIAWARETGARKSQSFSNIEIYEKLPPVWLE